MVLQICNLPVVILFHTPNFDGGFNEIAVDASTWMNNYIPYSYVDGIDYPCRTWNVDLDNTWR